MLVAIDIDGTLIAAEDQDVEQKQALTDLGSLVDRRGARIVLATGRSLAQTLELVDLVRRLPLFGIVANGGAEVFTSSDGRFERQADYEASVGETLEPQCREELRRMFAAEGAVWLQEPERQFPGKLSFYVRADAVPTLRARIAHARGLFPACDFLLSYNEPAKGYHYFDVQSKWATKYTALQFVARRIGVSVLDMIYFGDNGNDVPCLRHIPRSYLIETHLESLRQDGHEIDWDRIRVLDSPGARSIVQVLRSVI